MRFFLSQPGQIQWCCNYLTSLLISFAFTPPHILLLLTSITFSSTPFCPPLRDYHPLYFPTSEKLCTLYTTEYYSALKKKKTLAHATTRTSLEDIKLHEIGRSWKDKHWLHLCEVYEIVRLLEAEGRRVVARGCGKKKTGRWCSVGTKFQLCKLNTV